MLLDHIPDFILELSRYVGDLREGLTPEMPEELPRIHAIERLDLGFDLAEVVQEYATLRQCIVGLVMREGSPAMRSLQLERLHRAIDQAIATSASRYSEARARTLKALDRVSTASLGAGQDVESFLPTMLQVLLDTTASVDAACVLLREGDELRVRAAVGRSLQDPDPLPVGRCIAGAVARSRQTVLVRDASTDPRVASEALRRGGTRALYGVPLLLGDELIGVALIGSSSTSEFSHEDLVLFRTMVTRAAALFSQVRLLAEVQQQRNLYGSLLQAQSDVGEGFAVLEGHRVAYLNGALAQLLGYAPEELADRADLADLAVPEQRAALRERLRRAISGEAAPERSELALLRRSGERIEVEAAFKPIAGGRLILVAHDVTARKRAEQELRNSVDLRDLMMSVLGHDLRQPLNVVAVATAALQRETDPERRKKNLDRVLVNARRMERMISDLLDYTRLRQGVPLPVLPRPADLGALAEQAVDAVQSLHPNRPLKVESAGPLEGVWDPDRILQVIGNLLGNAVAYSPTDSPVTVRLRGGDGHVRLEVSNGGAPIAPAVLPHVFEPFRRGARDLRSAGLGLGLYIVRQIVSAHGGEVTADSSEAAGTTFAVRLPRRAAAPA